MTYVSEGVRELTGRCRDDFISGVLTWAEFMHCHDLPEIASVVERAICDRNSFEVSYRVNAVGGRVRWVQERGRAYYEDGTPKFLEGFIWDISAAKEAEEEARWIANHDPLTLLPNRLLFQETVASKIKSGDESRFAILLLDLDDFKRTNDTLGHDAGDTLLKEFASRVRAAIRPEDFLARLGGDEFAILLDGIFDASAVAATGQTIFNALKVPFHHGTGLLTCSASIGASVFGQHGRSYRALLKRADVALYAAKAAGRGNLKLFSQHMLNEVQVRSSMLALATSALDSNKVLPHYQPKVDLRSGKVVGFEALMRWRDCAGSVRPPGEIAAAFDDPILAAQVSDRMIDCVLRDIRTWLDSGIDFNHVAVNASAAQFQRGDFADHLLSKLSDAGIAPNLLEVEVTETVFLGRGSRYVENALNMMHKAGIAISLDDFGTGYASLLHLAQYPVETLKIDRSFVAKMMSSNHDDAIVQAVISLAHSLGMTVVAEGVETLEQEARLRAKGCDYAQGFLYAPALPSEQIREVCAQSKRAKFS
jgi:diguanylate cyclase (GGDEF)-like protein/PAS domain S-box-containing protein